MTDSRQSPTSQPSQLASKLARPARWGDSLPGPVASLVILLCLITVILAHLTGIRGDRGEVNLATYVGSFIVALTLVIWFVFRSRYRARLRYGFLALLAVAISVLALTVRVDQVSGEMVPIFRFVWQVPSDQSLGKLEFTGGPIDLSTTTPLDFPQFLGPDRNGRIETLSLARDWSKQPPQLIWKQRIGAGWSAFSAVNGFAVTMEQRGNDEMVTCYEVHTGKMRWAHSFPARHQTVLGGVGPRSTPTISEGRVYALGATGILRCLNGANGQLIWKRDLLEEFKVPRNGDVRNVAWGRSGSPLIVDDLVVVPAGGTGNSIRSLVAFDKQAGRRVWASGDRQVSYSSPILATINNRRQIVSVNEDSASGHDPATGGVLWSFDWPGNSAQAANTSQPLIYQDSVIVSKGYSQGCARFEIQNGKPREVYRNPRVLRTKLTSGILDGKFAYGLSDGILECVDVTDGTRKWKGGRYGHGQILLVKDVLLVLAETGELALVNVTPDEYQELATIEAIDGKTWNNLCLYGRFLLVRNSEEAACFELPLREQQVR